MKVKDLMSTIALKVVSPRDTLELAAGIMAWAEVVHVPVVDDRGRVVGVLSARDLLSPHSPHDRVATYMTSPPVTVSPDEDLAVAAMTMAARRIGCLPVIDDGALVGILTTGDLLAYQVSGTLHHRVDPGPAIGPFVTGEVQTVRAGDALLDAVARMSTHGVRHLPVVDGDGRLVGMLSDRDVRSAVGSLTAALEHGAARARIKVLSVGDVMSRRPISAQGDASLAEIARLLAEKRVSAVPIVDDDHRVVGLLSYVDVLRAAGAAL
jgi:CBS domain-containing protein